MAASTEILAERYALIRLLGQGGFADVFLAEDVTDGTRVAVKRFRDSSADREVNAAKRLSHPHIVRLLNSGQDDGQRFLVFEYVEGETLRERLKTGGPLPEDEAIRLAAELSSALDHAHAHGVLHNDLKPENVILGPNGAQLLDFGAARSLRDTVSIGDPEQLAGTLAYIAPEVLEGEDPTERSDIYSLALVLVEALTGRVPSVMRPGARGGSPLPEFGLAPLPPLLIDALSASPEERPQSAGALAAALNGAAPTVRLERTKTKAARKEGPKLRPPRRRRSAGLLLGVMITGLLLMLAGLGFAVSSQNGGETAGFGTSGALMTRVAAKAQEAATSTPAIVPKPTATTVPPTQANGPAKPTPKPKDTPKPKGKGR